MGLYSEAEEVYAGIEATQWLYGELGIFQRFLVSECCKRGADAFTLLLKYTALINGNA